MTPVKALNEKRSALFHSIYMLSLSQKHVQNFKAISIVGQIDSNETEEVVRKINVIKTKWMAE